MRPLIVLAGGLLLITGTARADHVAPITDPVTLKACGECHMAYQPAFLPARSWTRMMTDLDTHFGESAAMAPEKAAHIRAVLEEGAGDRVGGKVPRKFLAWVAPGAAPQRITDNPAFKREHDFAARVWARPEVKTPANCPACHTRAERGDYEDE
jgi:hypothetical protein